MVPQDVLNPWLIRIIKSLIGFITDLLEIISTASTAANSYADSVGSTALTAAQGYTDSAINDAITGITHPEYSIVTATPASNIYSATYQLTKDSNAVLGAAPINIPKSSNGKLENELVEFTGWKKEKI